jgi:hypothetical protein
MDFFWWFSGIGILAFLALAGVALIIYVSRRKGT